jgi:hypothetical protein
MSVPCGLANNVIYAFIYLISPLIYEIFHHAYHTNQSTMTSRLVCVSRESLSSGDDLDLQNEVMTNHND